MCSNGFIPFKDSGNFCCQILKHKYKFVIRIQNQIVSINYQRLLKCVILFGKSMGFLFFALAVFEKG